MKKTTAKGTVKKNIHGGHRERLRRRYLKDSLASFEDHNILELLLFNTIPQGDTNPAAHNLIERFGSLSDVFSATFDELCEVDGIGEKSAAMICSVMDSAREAVLREISEKPMDTECRIATYLQWWFRGRRESTVSMLIFDKERYIKEAVLLSEGKLRTPESYFQVIQDKCVANGSSDFILSHNHRDGRMIPSAEDIQFTSYINEHCKEAGIKLIDHYIVSGFDYIIM